MFLPNFRPSRLRTHAVVLIALSTLWALGCQSDQGASTSETDSGDDYADKMAVEHADDTTEASPATFGEPKQPVSTETVAYAEIRGQQIQGYLARPAEASDVGPGIIVIQEWWGLNENIEAMARQLAGEGYVALAVDLYSGQVAEDREQARNYMQEATAAPDQIDANLRQAYEYLESLGVPTVGSIGWCFGGGMSLRTATLMPTDLDAAVIYYGHVGSDEAMLEPLAVPILGHFGSEDDGIPLASVNAFRDALEALGKDASIYIYEGADHAFANPTGNRYDADAATKAWDRTLAFFDQHLRSGETPTTDTTE